MFRYRIVYRRRRRRKGASSASKKRYALYKEEARALVHAKIAELNAHYGYKLNKVFIKNSRSRWGSCSSRGNLNFNYRIVFLRPELQDYLIVHELCHLGSFDHSAAFWALVAQKIPAYQGLRREIRRVPIR
jgi:predicted metal-dependent hydrolase